jgi:hypothetical protein
MPRKMWTQSLVLENINELIGRAESLAHGQVAVAHPRLLYAAERYFGSWGSALAAAGVDVAEIRSASKASRAEKVGKWSKETIIDQIKEMASRGERMTGLAVRMKYPSLYYATVSERYFGSWKRAMEEAGIHPAATRPKANTGDAWRSRLLLDRIQELRRQYGELNQELAKAVCPDILQAAEERFGDWSVALELAAPTEAA